MADVLIVGAGLAGLACGRRLAEMGLPFTILEGSDAVGGRLRTDIVDGFRLDRGFQVLLTASPEARRHFDYDALRLQRLDRAALIRVAGKFHRFDNSLRSLLRSFGPVSTLGDKWKIMELEQKLRGQSLEELFEQPEGLTLDLLRWHDFSDHMIDRFFRPLCAVLFLERDLVTSSRLFRFLFQMMASGEVAVPEEGIQALPNQLAARLPADSIRLNAQVSSIDTNRVTLATGEVIAANAIIIATSGVEAARLLGWPAAPHYRGVTCLYFAAPKSPINEPVIVLNGDAVGPINHLAVMSDIAAGYAPPGQALICASVLGTAPKDDEAQVADVRQQLAEWFGDAAEQWRHLRTYRIVEALPDQTAPALDPVRKPLRTVSGCYVCGDHRAEGTINGALFSGWQAAQAVAEDLSSV